MKLSSIPTSFGMLVYFSPITSCPWVAQGTCYPSRIGFASAVACAPKDAAIPLNASARTNLATLNLRSCFMTLPPPVPRSPEHSSVIAGMISPCTACVGKVSIIRSVPRQAIYANELRIFLEDQTFFPSRERGWSGRRGGLVRKRRRSSW